MIFFFPFPCFAPVRVAAAFLRAGTLLALTFLRLGGDDEADDAVATFLRRGDAAVAAFFRLVGDEDAAVAAFFRLVGDEDAAATFFRLVGDDDAVATFLRAGALAVALALALARFALGAAVAFDLVDDVALGFCGFGVLGLFPIFIIPHIMFVCGHSIAANPSLDFSF
jgi:hypothetical protein